MPGDSKPYDALIVGGGHNGLVCACYLAAAKLRVCVVERRGVVGGAAVTEEFHPGFRNSTASYTVSLLNPKVIRELRLAEHGLRVVERPFSNFLPSLDGNFIKVGGGLEATQREVARFSKRDAERLPAYYERLERVADVLRDLMLETPPNVGGGVAELFRAWKTGRALNALPLAAKRDVLDLFTLSAADWLDRWFESDPIKACFGFDSVLGNFASPYTPGSAYVLLHHVFGEVNGKKGTWGHAIGGMGAITQAMRREAEARGVEIRTGRGVARILSRSARARRGTRRRHRDRREMRGLERASTCAARIAARRAGGLARGVRQLPVRVGDLPHECRTRGAAGFLRAARPRGAAAPSLGNHPRALARVHGPRLFERARGRMVAG